MGLVDIKKIELKDLGQLQKISQDTFFETFSSTNTPENLNSYLASSFSKEKLTLELKNPCSAFYFATYKKEPIGYLKVNKGEAQTETQVQESLEIERIYVLKQYHGKKVGQLLLDKAIEIALQYKSTFIWLGVWENNKRAIAFYQKNGFIEFDKHVFKMGKEQQTDLMMKKELL